MICTDMYLSNYKSNVFKRCKMYVNRFLKDSVSYRVHSHRTEMLQIFYRGNSAVFPQVDLQCQICSKVCGFCGCGFSCGIHVTKLYLKSAVVEFAANLQFPCSKIHNNAELLQISTSTLKSRGKSATNPQHVNNIKNKNLYLKSTLYVNFHVNSVQIFFCSMWV